ncbi:MAG: hypothetical protein ACI8UO_004142 [Verrucomicrobiales bacterium]|jgi:hypothetical protein
MIRPKPLQKLAIGSLLLLFAVRPLLSAPEAFETHAGNVEALPEGREADGIIGDFILRNDMIEAVIAGNQPLRRPNMSTFYGEGNETPGALYDLTLLGEGNDQLTIWSPNNQRGRVSWVKVVEEPEEGEAAIEVMTTSALGGGLSRRHVYRVRDGVPGVFVDTTIRNSRSGPAEIDLRDMWTNFLTHGIHDRYHWADAVDPSDKCGYAYAWLEPNEVEHGRMVTLRTGEEINIKRLIMVGNSPAEAIGLTAAHLDESGVIEAALVDPDGKPVTDAALWIPVTGRARIPAYSDERGKISIPFLKGKFDAFLRAPGRPKLELEIDTMARAEVAPEIPLGAVSAIAFQVTDGDGASIPCKAQFHGIDGTPQPNLGPTIRAHGCVDQWHSERGDFEVRIPPGKYRVVVTRGPEYGHHEEEVTVEPGETSTVEARLEHQVDSSGWISADFHNHSTPSGDNVCGTDDRVINMAAEHLEFTPTTEHNRVYDWTPHIQKLGLTNFITTIPGVELTGRGAHINCFPLTPVPRTQDGGAPVWVNDPRINIAALRNLGGHVGSRWTQINHPNLSENFLDRNGDKEIDGGFLMLGGMLDAVETQNYSGSHILSTAPFHIAGPLAKGSRISQVREFVWLQLLNQGEKLWAVGVADAHHVYGNGTGSWRCFIPSKTDKPNEIDLDEILDHARRGHMIVSSAPFLEVTTPDGALPGDTVRPGPKGVELKIRVQCADWYDIDRVQVLVNGVQDKRLNFTREKHPTLFTDDVVRFDQSITINFKSDAHLIVVAFGHDSTLEKGFGTSAQSSIHPCAYNNPIFVDVDGNGFEANRDTLGYPLPAGGLSVDEVKEILENR